jgi:photosystem II stability/assembly factor-like uncharacterized protein
MRKLAWGLLLGLFLSNPAVAGVGVWTAVGGIEPVYSRLLVDPVDPETLYALVFVRDPDSSHALWKSIDGGETWRSIQNGIPPIRLLAVDPLQPGRLYSWDVSNYSMPKLWASEDRGETWTLRYDAEVRTTASHFWQILASPVRRGVLYGLTDTVAGEPPFGSAIYRSADGGATWTRRGAVGTSRVSTESLLHHPTRNLLEYFDNDAFSTSHDNGLTWTVRGTYRGQGFLYVTRSAAAPDRLFAIPSPGTPCLVRSDNGGTTWKKSRSLPAFPGSLSCSGVAVDPADPDLIRVTAEGQIGRGYVHQISTSRDGGATWSRPRSFPSSFPVATGGDPDTVFAAGGNGYPAPGPYRSADDGQTWTPSWDGITAGNLHQDLVALPGTGGNPLLASIAWTAGLADTRLARSLDGGATWELPVAGEVRQLEADANGRTLYALRSANGHVVRSRDGGVTWAAATPGGSLYFGGLFADPFQPGRLFATTETGSGPTQTAVWRTPDGGRSWARRNAGLPVTCSHVASVDICPFVTAVTSDPRHPDRMLMAFGTGEQSFLSDPVRVYLSPNGGRRWQLAAQSPPESVVSLTADPGTPGAFLAGTVKGIYRSVDGGNHWTEVQPGLPVMGPVWQLLRDGHSGAWYAVVRDQGVFRSTDGGNTWVDLSAGLPDLARLQIVIDPQTPDRLFAAAGGLGLWSWSAPGS